MDLQLYLTFTAMVTVLMLIPGPNVALIVANSLSHGRSLGLVTVAGTWAAMVIQLAATAAGLSSLLGDLGSWFSTLRWIGVCYLFYLGIAAFRARPAAVSAAADKTAAGTILVRGFLVSLTNPKTLFFYAAFFPQFLDNHAALGPQIAVLSGTFLLLAALIDSGWALLAARLRHVLATRDSLRRRVTGAVFIGAGLSLATARKAAG